MYEQNEMLKTEIKTIEKKWKKPRTEEYNDWTEKFSQRASIAGENQ